MTFETLSNAVFEKLLSSQNLFFEELALSLESPVLEADTRGVSAT